MTKIHLGSSTLSMFELNFVFVNQVFPNKRNLKTALNPIHFIAEYKMLNLTPFINVLDIDECKEQSNVCKQNQICENQFGSYRCICKTGFRLSSSGLKCVGKLFIFTLVIKLIFYRYMKTKQTKPNLY